jgi:hypothetical protein
MMFRCSSRFSIKDEQDIDAALTQDERHTADEQGEESDQLFSVPLLQFVMMKRMSH